MGTAGQAQAVVLDFSGLGLTNGQSVPQTYGDQPNLDVSYRSVASPGSNVEVASSMQYWPTQYSDLTDVAYGFQTAEVTLTPSAGHQVSLLGFDLGAWPNTDRQSQVSIYNLDYSALLFSTGSITVSGVTASNFSFANLTRTDGIKIQFGPDAFNVGIDNIEFTVSTNAVPEPLTLLGAGTALGFGTFFKRKLPKTALKTAKSQAS